MSLIRLIEEARRQRDFNLFSQAIPYARFLGIESRECDGQLHGFLHYRERNIGNPAVPALHGGVVGAFLETTAIFQLMWQRETASVPKTINITIDYLRPAGPRDTWARAVVTKQGRRIANVAVEAWQESPEKPITTADCHFLLAAD